jgi:FKBP-type peptidyl-prolyl cis-trans isomerase
VRRLVRPISTDLTREPKVRSPGRTTKAPRRVVKDDVVRCSTGAVVRRGDTVEVRYSMVVWGRGSTPRESSWSRTPTSASFPLNRSAVIDGWVDAIPGMRVGGRRVLVVPPSKGYGSEPVGKTPRNSTLIFVVDVVATS